MTHCKSSTPWLGYVLLWSSVTHRRISIITITTLGIINADLLRRMSLTKYNLERRCCTPAGRWQAGTDSLGMAFSVWNVATPEGLRCKELQAWTNDLPLLSGTVWLPFSATHFIEGDVAGTGH